MRVTEKIIRIIELAQEIDDPALSWVADALKSYAQSARDGLTLEEAFGLVPLRGGEEWWRQEARAHRDEAIHRLAAKCYPDVSITRLSSLLQADIVRYRRSEWASDKRRGSVPSYAVGTPRECLFQIFYWAEIEASAVPESAKQLRRILLSAGFDDGKLGHETGGFHVPKKDLSTASE